MKIHNDWLYYIKNEAWQKRVDNSWGILYTLTHWGRATHICVGNLTINGSDNGLSPGRRQAIIWTNTGILLIRPLGTNFNEMLIEILTFSFMKMRLKVSSAKWRPFCLGLNVLRIRMGYVAPQPLLGLLSWYPVMSSSLCSSSEDRVPVDEIDWGAINWPKCINPSNGCHGDILYKMFAYSITAYCTYYSSFAYAYTNRMSTTAQWVAGLAHAITIDYIWFLVRPFLRIDISYTSIRIRAFILNYGHLKQWYVIRHHAVNVKFYLYCYIAIMYSIYPGLITSPIWQGPVYFTVSVVWFRCIHATHCCFNTQLSTYQSNGKSTRHDKKIEHHIFPWFMAIFTDFRLWYYLLL